VNVRAVIIPGSGANFGSLRQACARIGVEAEVSDDPARVGAASHVILPGVGAAGHAMRGLRERGVDRLIRRLGQPLLGICLGMQLLFEHSEEDAVDCLGVLPGQVRRLPPEPRWPHMGWNRARAIAGAALFDGVDADAWFYFVHGYAVPIDATTEARTDYGTPFASAVRDGRVHGVQFHPEKSAAAGRRILANFFSSPC
jgi:imidazole glycerol-phosphate synthase subunit HisH